MTKRFYHRMSFFKNGKRKRGKNMKKILSLLLTVVFCVVLVLPIYASNEGIMPCYNNTGCAIAEFTISDTGLARVTCGYNGFSGSTTNATVNCKIEKRTLFWWSDVDGAEWTKELKGSSSSIQYLKQLPESGRYRMTYEITVYGSGGAPDVITGEIEKEY